MEAIESWLLGEGYAALVGLLFIGALLVTAGVWSVLERVEHSRQGILARASVCLVAIAVGWLSIGGMIGLFFRDYPTMGALCKGLFEGPWISVVVFKAVPIRGKYVAIPFLLAYTALQGGRRLFCICRQRGWRVFDARWSLITSRNARFDRNLCRTSPDKGATTAQRGQPCVFERFTRVRIHVLARPAWLILVVGKMKNLRGAAQWMWAHRGQNIWWEPKDLTPENSSDPTNPQLNRVQAESVFRALEDEKLIFPTPHPQDRNTVYLLNEVKEKQWEAFFRTLSPFHRFIVKPLISVFGAGWKVIIWLVSLVIASSIGAFFSTWIKTVLE